MSLVMSEIDVFVGNYTLINWDIYELWIQGLTIPECVTYLREKGFDYPGVTQEHLVSDLKDNYRLFSMLENLLLATGKLSEQMCFQVDNSSKRKWVERYYSLDNVLCRELLGKKLSSRLKKDLDEISDKTGIHLNSCRRQFDNIKRISKSIEELPGCFVHNISTQFNLPRSLAEKYATLVFINSFRIEVNKRRLNYLNFQDLMTASLILIDKWMDVDSSYEPCLDREFLSSLRELKILNEREKEHRNIVLQQITNNEISSKSYLEIENNFKLLTRNILNIAQGLYNNKEIKDFFVHVVEKIVEPLKGMQLSKEEVNHLLIFYTSAITNNILLIDQENKIIFSKFMDFLSPCVNAFYK